MSILHEILSAATSSEVPISDLLRRVRVLATHLANAELTNWVDRELNGYPDQLAVPEYRTISAVAYGNFIGPFGRSLDHIPIPAAILPESSREWATKVNLAGPIRAYEELLKNPDEEIFQIPWPGDLILLVQRKVIPGMSLMSAGMEIARGAIVGLVDTVRNRTLTFALDLEQMSPELGESEIVKPATKDRVAQAFHTNIYAPVGNVAVGSTGVHQLADLTVEEGNLESLAQALLQLSVPKEDITQLKEAISADGTGTKKGFGPRVSDWLGRVVSNAASGAGKVTLATATEILPKLISKYSGLP